MAVAATVRRAWRQGSARGATPLGFRTRVHEIHSWGRRNQPNSKKLYLTLIFENKIERSNLKFKKIFV